MKKFWNIFLWKEEMFCGLNLQLSKGTTLENIILLIKKKTITYTKINI